MKLIVFLILFLLLFSSCRKLVQNEFPEFLPVPVVNSILIADSLIKVHVSLAEKLDTYKLGWVENARVSLCTDGQFTEEFSYSEKGFYSGITIVEPGKTYSCEVEIPGFETVSCIDSIPEPTEFLDIIHKNIAGFDVEGMSYPSITFTFKSNPVKSEYYEAVIKFFDYGSTSNALIIYITDPVLLNEGLPIAVFSNELIKQDTYTMSLNYTTGSASSIDNEPLHTDLFLLCLELRSISYDYYRYVKDLYLYETGRYPAIVGGVVTPFQLHSNVENGLGIFAGYSHVVSDTIFPGSVKNISEYGPE